MAYHKSFGEELYHARVSRGLTFGTISRDLHIRTDILQALENEDFSLIPPYSYARNMVNSYALYLGLDAKKLVENYSCAAQRNDPRFFTRSSRPDRNEAALRERQSRRTSSSSRHQQSEAQFQNRYSRTRANRVRHESNTSQTRRSQTARNTRQNNNESVNPLTVLANIAAALVYFIQSKLPSHKHIDVNHSIYSDSVPKRGITKKNIRQPFGVTNSQHNIMSAKNYGVKEKGLNVSALKLCLVIAGIIIILFIIINVLFAPPSSTQNSADTNSNSQSSMAISGLTDPGSSGTVEKETVVVPIAPTAAVFTYRIEDGQDCYLEIYVDDESTPSVAGTFTGPKNGTYDVTGTLTFVTSRPGVVTIKVDGTTVEMHDNNNDGVYEYNVNFSDILAAWKEANLPASESS